MNSTSTTCDIYAIRCRRKEDDEFFYRGNDISYQDEDVIVSYIEKRYVEDSASVEMNQDGKQETFYCCAPHCHEGFDTIYECEEHYIKQHNHECRFCKRVFPNEFLLDLVRSIVYISTYIFANLIVFVAYTRTTRYIFSNSYFLQQGQVSLFDYRLPRTIYKGRGSNFTFAMCTWISEMVSIS